MDKKVHRTPTPPSEAPGESGDREARKQAEEALETKAGDAPGTGTATPQRAAGQHRPGRRKGSGPAG